MKFTDFEKEKLESVGFVFNDKGWVQKGDKDVLKFEECGVQGYVLRTKLDKKDGYPFSEQVYWTFGRLFKDLM